MKDRQTFRNQYYVLTRHPRVLSGTQYYRNKSHRSYILTYELWHVEDWEVQTYDRIFVLLESYPIAS